jgi:hypothetical protein
MAAFIDHNTSTVRASLFFVRGAGGPEGAFEQTLLEIAAEKAAALRRIGERLDALVSELAALLASLPPPGDPARPRGLERLRGVHGEARRYRWYLEVQREAIGLFRHEQLDVHYPIPPLPRS